jgi:hypothetical protein
MMLGRIVEIGAEAAELGSPDIASAIASAEKITA